MFRFGAAAQAPTKICGNTRHMPRHGLMPRTAEFVAPGVASTGKFGRLLPYLDPLRVGDESLVELASKMLESVGGTDDNPDVPAAYTYLGQFIDHNVTFDATSIEEARIDPASVVNYRSPRLDLDSVYGSGPVVQPHLYQRDDPDLLEIGCAQHFTNARRSNKVVADIGLQADLPRGWNRFALIADPRNDENLIVAQLHLAFLHFHNNIVGWLRTDSARRQAPLRKSVFVEARDLAIRHYQWIVLHDFLPRIVCREVLEEVRRGKSMMAEQNRLYMPVEFSAAAYRFGHSALRPLYNINSAHLKAPLLDLFKFSGRTGSRAQVPITDNWIVEWFRLLNLDPAMDNTLSRRIDPYLADDLAKLPLPGRQKQSLPATNLLRGNMLGLPAGQSVAGYFGYPALTQAQIADETPDGIVAAKHGFDRDTPLWYYILKEALVFEKGWKLGPVGSRIVAEVFVGMLQLDENSILNRARNWKPMLSSATDGEFTLPDLLRFARVLPQNDHGFGPALNTPCGHKVRTSCYSPVAHHRSHV